MVYNILYFLDVLLGTNKLLQMAFLVSGQNFKTFQKWKLG